MNINFPGFWHRLLSEDWLQEEMEHSFHHFSGLKGSDGLVNGKQAETMTIPRPVRKDKRRSESELPGKMVPTSGLFSETQRDRGDDKASSCFRLHNWHQVADSQAGRGGKGPRQTAWLWNGPSAKKELHQLLTVQDPPPAASISSLSLEEIHAHCCWFYLYVFYPFMFIRGLNFKYLRGCLFHFNLFISSIFLI